MQPGRREQPIGSQLGGVAIQQVFADGIDCVIDEDVPVDEDGTYTIVISAPADKPCDAALASNDAAWLKCGTSQEAHLMLRHMLPAASFAEAIQRVERPGELADGAIPAGRHAHDQSRLRERRLSVDR